MSFRSERRIRRVIVASAGISLLGAGTAFVDFGASHRIFAMSDIPPMSDIITGSTVTRTPPASNAPAVKPLPAKMEFKTTGKQDRADLAVTAKPAKAAVNKPAKADQPEILTASLVEMPFAAVKKPTVLQDVNRGGKADRLTPTQVSVAKFVAPQEDLANVRASAAVFLVSPPLADVQVPETAAPSTAKPAAAETKPDVKLASVDAKAVAADAKPVASDVKPEVKLASADPKAVANDAKPITADLKLNSADTQPASADAATVKGPVDDTKLAATDMRPSGKSYWDDLVKMASVKADDSSDKKMTFFGGFTEKEEHARQLRCMATAIYFEARDEPLRGQIAVAQVIMTRVKSEYYPKTICEVVYQGAQHKNSCQFSFACDGKADLVHEKKEWATALDVARQVISGKVYLTDIANSTHYHATYVHPEWRKLVKRIKQIGGHIFYKADFAPPLIANADNSKL